MKRAGGVSEDLVVTESEESLYSWWERKGEVSATFTGVSRDLRAFGTSSAPVREEGFLELLWEVGRSLGRLARG